MGVVGQEHDPVADVRVGHRFAATLGCWAVDDAAIFTDAALCSSVTTEAETGFGMTNARTINSY